MDALIGKFDKKNGYEQMRVITTTYNGKTYVDVRIYVLVENDWKATKKGITINDTDAHTLAKLVEKATEFIATNKVHNATTV